MELYVYGKDRRLAGMVESFEYLRWTRRYSSVGGFELRAIASRENLALLVMGNILWKSDDAEAGFIEYVELTSEEQEFILVQGRFASGILSRRIVWGTETLRGDISEVVGSLLDRHLLNPTDASRKIGGFAFSAPKLGVSLNTQTSYKPLLALVESLCEPADIGFKTVWDRVARTVTFMLYRGADSQAVFSKDYENLTAQTYVRSELAYSNTALVGGEGEGDNRQTVTLGNASGIDRREMFVDAKDLRRADFGTDYAAALTQRGYAKLAEQAAVQAFDAAINPHGNLKYKLDFDLGQTVRVVSAQWGVTLTTRITEIEESYDQDGLTLQVVFGRGLLTLSQKLKGGA
jgi:hypothetical protein